ncbi:MAG: hypothetical protein ACP5N3_05860 [Candidatus Nanoarchaeia archaeon]
MPEENNNEETTITSLDTAILESLPSESKYKLQKSIEFWVTEDEENERIDPYTFAAIVQEIHADLSETPYTEGRLKKIKENCDLSMDETRQVADLLREYNVKPNKIEKLILGNVPMKELEGYINFIKNNNGEVYFEERQVDTLSKVPTEKYYISNTGNYISYDSMLFMRTLTHNGTIDQIVGAIENLDLILQEEDPDLGIGVLIHRMRNLYDSDENMRSLSVETLAYAAINKIPTTDNYD